MSGRSQSTHKFENNRGVLRGYQRKGKRFIPPFLQYINPEESRWMDHRVPELVWIALLMQFLGVKEGTEVAKSIAQAAAKCERATKRAFAAASDYVELGNEQKQCIRSVLDAEGVLDKARWGLAALILNYNEFPLAFLTEAGTPIEGSSGSSLDDLRTVIDNISDRHGYDGTLVQATVVYIYFINNMLKVSPHVGLANFPAIEEYPRTEESQRVAASVRSAVTMLLTRDMPSDWRNSFWNQGRTLGPCEVS